MTKPWYESKTVWLNLISIVIGVAGLFVTGEYGEDVAKIAALIAAVGNLVLRIVFTDTAIRR